MFQSMPSDNGCANAPQIDYKRLMHRFGSSHRRAAHTDLEEIMMIHRLLIWTLALMINAPGSGR